MTLSNQSGRSPKVVALFLLQTLVAISYDYFNCMIQSKRSHILVPNLEAFMPQNEKNVWLAKMKFYAFWWSTWLLMENLFYLVQPLGSPLNCDVICQPRMACLTMIQTFDIQFYINSKKNIRTSYEGMIGKMYSDLVRSEMCYNLFKETMCYVYSYWSNKFYSYITVS